MSFGRLTINPKLSYQAMEYFYPHGQDPAVIAETNRGFQTEEFPFDVEQAFNRYHEKTLFGR